MSGPPPKPTTLKKLAGNPGKRRLNEHEPRPPVPDRAPYAPRYLCDEAQAEWRRITGVLLELGLYTEVDRTALAMYCQAFGRWVEAERELQRTGGPMMELGKGALLANPWVKQVETWFDRLRKMLAEFGLSPAQRSRVMAAAQPEQLSLAEMLFHGVDEG